MKKIFKSQIAFLLCLVAAANAAPYVAVAIPVVPAVVHHPANVVHSNTVVQSHPSPPVVARVVAAPVVHPVAVNPVAVHPVVVRPVAVHPVAVHPVVPVSTVVHY
ncbi:Hypothetical protein CINCED_3A020635 [Cinara cedri]|uniref:Uncharacterized protein n=1 Tax=Cinara cedri TaxID=506608 RepID=A0A5E4MDC3_9HEMI|nr:Hypothetical protein CINCED_3A020635 [Cinara cedri]